MVRVGCGLPDHIDEVAQQKEGSAARRPRSKMKGRRRGGGAEEGSPARRRHCKKKGRRRGGGAARRRVAGEEAALQEEGSPASRLSCQ